MNNETRAPFPGEYADPQPVAVDVEGDERVDTLSARTRSALRTAAPENDVALEEAIREIAYAEVASLCALLADTIEEGSGRGQSENLNAHNLANAVRLASLRLVLDA